MAMFIFFSILVACVHFYFFQWQVFVLKLDRLLNIICFVFVGLELILVRYLTDASVPPMVEMLTAVLGVGLPRGWSSRWASKPLRTVCSEGDYSRKLECNLLLAAPLLLPTGQRACVKSTLCRKRSFQNRSTVLASFFCFFARPLLLVGRRVAEKQDGPTSALALAAFMSAWPRSGSSAASRTCEFARPPLLPSKPS